MFMRIAARLWYAVTALVVLIGITVQLLVTIGGTTGFFTTPAARAANVFCFFTIQSNLIVGGTSLLLAINPVRRSTLFRTLRLDGVVAIAVTFVVYHTALADLHDLDGSAAYADFLLHTLSPILCVVGWLIFGPRPVLTLRVVGWSLAYPVCWLIFTLIRGAIIGFYPYPFLDAAELGYGRTLLNCVIIAVLFVGLAAAAMGLERLLARWHCSFVPERLS
jgi:hypothetical protein